MPRNLGQEGAQNVIISMAGDDLLSLSVQTVLTSQKEANQGSSEEFCWGWRFHGGRLHWEARNNLGDVIEAFKWGVACGTATTFSDRWQQWPIELMKSRGRKT